MSVDDLLLVGRVVFLAALWLFLFFLAQLMRRELRSGGSRAEERAPGDLMVLEPGKTGLETSERIPLLAMSRIGRDGENDIVLDDGFLSAEHARLNWNGRGWVLEDLGSTNGTRVNGKDVRRAVVVRNGDTIEFGPIKVKLVQP